MHVCVYVYIFTFYFIEILEAKKEYGVFMYFHAAFPNDDILYNYSTLLSKLGNWHL